MPLIGYAWYAALWATTDEEVQHWPPFMLSESLNALMTKPPVQSSSMQQHWRDTGSEQQLGVRHGCLLSPTFFNISLDWGSWLMPGKNHEGTVSIGGRTYVHSPTFALLMTLTAYQDWLRRTITRQLIWCTGCGFESPFGHQHSLRSLLRIRVVSPAWWAQRLVLR